MGAEGPRGVQQRRPSSWMTPSPGRPPRNSRFLSSAASSAILPKAEGRRQQLGGVHRAALRGRDRLGRPPGAFFSTALHEGGESADGVQHLECVGMPGSEKDSQLTQRTRLFLLASAVLAATLLPVGSAGTALAAPAMTQAPAAAGTCQETLDGVFCGYDRSDAYTDRGDSSAKVKEVQALLIYHGYSVGSTGVDGHFGAGTQSAVKRFQTAKRLTADGIVGANTWTKLRRIA